MGTWGTGIFADDTAADVRDVWREAILEGASPEQATARSLETFSQALDDEDDAIVFWVALATAQMETGRLQPEVRDRALAVIEAGGDVSRWEEQNPALARRREKVLAQLAVKLRGPQPKPKRIRPPRIYGVPFDVGDVVLLRNVEERAEALFAVVDQHPTRTTGVEPVVEALLWDGGAVPSVDELSLIPALLDEGLVVLPLAEREPGKPVAALRPRLFVVFTPTKAEAFGAHLGEVVAKGVKRAPSADFRTRDERGGDAFSSSCSWLFLVGWIAGPWYRRNLELTHAALSI